MTAFISPYREDRDFCRELVGKGRFIEVYVQAALDTCEQRDPKGMYKKARAGIIKQFTGIDAPYEAPLKPEIIIDTDTLNVEQSADLVLSYLKKHGYI